MDTLVEDVISAPEFEGRGRFLFVPERVEPGMTVGEYAAKFQSHEQALTPRVLNDLLDLQSEGRLSFLDIYTPEEKAADPDKADTVMLFLRGDPGAPFAEINAGGAFRLVCLLQEGLPPAIELARRGFNAFVLYYRVKADRPFGGEADPGYEPSGADIARALEYIFEHAGELGVSTDGYSVWGFSAGAWITGQIGSHGTEVYGARKLPKPAAQILAYVGYQEPTGAEPATYAMIGEQDPIYNWQGQRRRMQELEALGIASEFRSYPGMGHGFGMGGGSEAEGWFAEALEFWESQLGSQPEAGSGAGSGTH